MSYAEWDDYLPCFVKGCNRKAHDWGGDGDQAVSDGYPWFTRVGALTLRLALCAEHRRALIQEEGVQLSREELSAGARG